MTVRLGKAILGLAALLCVWDSITAPHSMGSKEILLAVMAFLLVLKSFTTASQSVTTVVGGCVVAFVAVGCDRGLLDEHKPVWLMLMLLGGVFFVFGERIEKWLRSYFNNSRNQGVKADR